MWVTAVVTRRSDERGATGDGRAPGAATTPSTGRAPCRIGGRRVGPGGVSTETPALSLALALDELAVRMGATALIVVLVTWAVGVFGPRIGGAIAGLPIVLGPGFYFLSTHADAAFVAEAAAYALYALCATQFFLLAYMLAAGRAPPAFALGLAVSTWGAIAVVLRLLPPIPSLGLLLFILSTAVGVKLGARLVPPVTGGGPRPGFGLLLLRGLLAGVLVAVVTEAAGWLGPDGAGLLMAFPIGYTVVALTLHQSIGAARAAATLHAAMLGTSSLAGFCATVALTVSEGTQHAALVGALVASLVVTIGLIAGRRHFS